jgi:hypothetical protein
VETDSRKKPDVENRDIVPLNNKHLLQSHFKIKFMICHWKYFRKQKTLLARRKNIQYTRAKRKVIAGWLHGAATRGIISLLDGWNHIILGIPT